MPLELRIDVVPGGIEEGRQQIGTVRITQVEKHDDDPGGERTYLVTGRRNSFVRHRRADGALVLCAKALASDAGLNNGSPTGACEFIRAGGFLLCKVCRRTTPDGAHRECVGDRALRNPPNNGSLGARDA